MMKENKCKMIFECENEDCVYMKGEKYCDYTNGKECNSTIAMVNRMVLKLKELGLEITVNKKSTVLTTGKTISTMLMTKSF